MKFWTTAKGQRIRLTDIDNEHLDNIIKMIEGKALVEKFRLRYEVANRAAPVNPIAIKLWKKELVRVEKYSAKDYHPLYISLLKEKQSRRKKR